MNLYAHLMNDDAGFVVSAELVLIATIAVISLVVGLSEISLAVNNELEDVGSAIGALNQTYSFQGTKGCKGKYTGSRFSDSEDECDNWCDIQTSAPRNEGW